MQSIIFVIVLEICVHPYKVNCWRQKFAHSK